MFGAKLPEVEEMRAITIIEANNRDTEEKNIVLDIRPTEYYEGYHIPEAVNIPYESLADREEELYKGLPVLFYCEHGGKSMQAAREYAGRGLKAASLGSGIQYYSGKYLVPG